MIVRYIIKGMPGVVGFLDTGKALKSFQPQIRDTGSKLYGFDQEKLDAYYRKILEDDKTAGRILWYEICEET